MTRNAPVGSPRVRLVGKPGCHLCDEARAVIESVCGELGEAWDEVSILDDPAMADQYWELIPVTLVDGAELCHWHVEAAALRRALAG
ncbi:MAG TPA: glutaredoxin family protein [Candidatus Nanopelagicales bacterium]